MSLIKSLDAITAYDIVKENDKIHLDLNEFDGEHHPTVMEAIRQTATYENITKYNYKGVEHQELKQRIADYVGVEPDNIIITNGCDAAINFVINMVDARRVCIHTPAYRQYERYATLARREVYKVDETRLMSFVPDRDLIFICTPGQPSGTLHADLERYIAAYPDSMFCLDETYMDYLQLTGQKCSNVSLIKKYKNVIILRSMSKAFGLAGARVGYLIAHRDITAALDRAFNHKEVPLINKMAAVAVFRKLDWYRDLAGIMLKNQQQIVSQLNALGVECDATPCNFITFRSPRVYDQLRRHGIVARDIGAGATRLSIPIIHMPHVVKCLQELDQ